MSTNPLGDFSYDSKYDNIVAEHSVQSSDFNGGQEGTGKLSFTIVTHDDDTFDTPLEDSAISTVGERIYFSVNIEKPIIGVEFAVAGRRAQTFLIRQSLNLFCFYRMCCSGRCAWYGLSNCRRWMFG